MNLANFGQTAAGQTREIALADGTRIRLNAASRITVSLDRDARRVQMADAEAVFDVAHDAKRPFLISVGDRQVRVVGTEFNLRHRADLVDLTVRRGVVEVRPADAPQAPPTRVTVGQEFVHTAGEAGSILKVSDSDQAFAWTGGQLYQPSSGATFKGDLRLVAYYVPEVAGSDVGALPRLVRHDQADRPVGIGLRRRGQREQHRQQYDDQTSHFFPPSSSARISLRISSAC